MAEAPSKWTRLEPYSRSENLEGLRAAIHDPLWLLTRQWQLGEFRGEDAGSPVFTRLQVTTSRLTRYLGGIPANTPVQGMKFDGDMPLEILIERERVRKEQTPQYRNSAEAGVYFLRLLKNHGGSENLRKEVIKQFPLRGLDEDLDRETKRFLKVVGSRIPDGDLLYSIFAVMDSPTGISQVPESERNRASAGVQTWQTLETSRPESDCQAITNTKNIWRVWYKKLFCEPDATENQSWITERMEYQAVVAAPLPGDNGEFDEVVLAAPEYTGKDLDWYTFNSLTASSLQASLTDLSLEEQERKCKQEHTAIPASVFFKGMPASRYWEFEDASVDFGAINVGKLHLAHLMLIEFGLVAGDDWFLLPVILPVGGVCRVDRLIVTDTFGEHTLVKSARALDQVEMNVQDPPWDMFRISSDRRGIANSPTANLLFLPPTLGRALDGPLLEEVFFLRDEMANMAWAVERVVESPIGLALNRSEASIRTRTKQSKESGSEANVEGALPKYRLRTEVPNHWIPLLPVRYHPKAPAIWFERYGRGLGRVLDPALNGHTQLFLREEEVPREGVRVIRSFQYARWTNGQSYLWMGRCKNIGRGEGASGLQFDVLDPAVVHQNR